MEYGSYYLTCKYIKYAVATIICLFQTGQVATKFLHCNHFTQCLLDVSEISDLLQKLKNSQPALPKCICNIVITIKYHCESSLDLKTS